MEWKSPFVIYRITPDAKIEEVFHTDDMKKAKYWLAYIAQPGDLLCRTPLHPKHTQKAKAPEYWQHKDLGGKPCSEEAKWQEMARAKNFDFKFPEEQLQTS